MKRLLLTYLLISAVLISGCSPFLPYTLLMDNSSGISSEFSLLEQDNSSSPVSSASSAAEVPATSSTQKTVSEPKTAVSSSVVSEIPETPQNAVKDYYYAQLNDTQKVIYEKIGAALQTLSQKAVINSAVKEEDITRAYYAYRWDNPQVFYIPSSYHMVFGKKTEIRFKYSSSATEIAALNSQLESFVAAGLSQINSSMSDFQKELILHNYLVDSTVYSENTDDSEVYTVIGVLKGSAVCEGYAKMMKLLFDRAGISTIIVSGFEKSSGNNVAHAWNIALVGGQYYHVDATFNDTVTNESGNSLRLYHITDSSKYIYLHSYQYFNLTDAALSKTHQIAPPDPEFSDFWFTMPECKSTAMSYFRQTGSVFSFSTDKNFLTKKQITAELTSFLNRKLSEMITTGYYYFYLQCDNLSYDEFSVAFARSCSSFGVDPSIFVVNNPDFSSGSVIYKKTN